MAISGHISAHKVHPVQRSKSEKTAMVLPRLLISVLMATSFLEQAKVHNPHPLQRCSSITIYGIKSILLIN